MNEKETHDISFVDGIQLDVFVYPKSYFENEIDGDEFIQIHDGIIEMDMDECALEQWIFYLEKKTNRKKRL